jgi:hypothetical protein
MFLSGELLGKIPGRAAACGNCDRQNLRIYAAIFINQEDVIASGATDLSPNGPNMSLLFYS